jgi:arginine decarboxylase
VRLPGVYASLVKEGAVMGFLDTGGGLAVDYDGSQTNFYASMNYSLSEYCSDLIDVVMSVMDEEGIHHPTLISESGRAVSAHSSVLLFNILDTNRLVAQEDLDDEDASPGANLKNLYEVLGSVSVKNIQESYHDALYYRDEIRTLFRTGGVDLRERGLADQTFWKIMSRIAKLIPDLRVVPEELQNLDRLLADVYYGNFSLFQSLPDSWAIDQLFPILPVHRLNEKPENTAVISDTTCDSDGKIDRFIDIADVRRALPLHEPIPGEDYIIGVYMIGAYQETLGDLHNLFGDTYALSVSLDDEGIVHFKDEIVGDSVADVLSYVEYEPKEMRELFRDKIEAAVRKNVLTPLDRRRILEAYEEGLRGYTYFES